MSLRGSPEAVARELGSDRARSEAGGAGRGWVADGVALSWTEFGERKVRVDAWGVGGARRGEVDALRVDLARLGSPGVALEVRGVALELARRGEARLRAARVASAEAAVDFDVLGRATAPVASAGPRPGVGGKPGVGGATPDVRSASFALGLAAVASVAKQALGEGVEARVESASFGLRFRGEALGFGPSRLSARREKDALALELLPSERPGVGATPLSLRGRLPLGEGAPSLELEGGPVSLAALGVRDGSLGLTRTREATLEAHLRVEVGDGSVRGSGTGSLANVAFRRPEVSPLEVVGLRVGFRANGEVALDGSRVSLRDTEVSVGDVKLAGNVSYERDEHGSRWKAAGGVPLASCDAVLTSIPSALLSEAAGLKLEGTFQLDHALAYDSAKPSALALTLHVENGCRVVAAPDSLSPQRFKGVWEREVKGPDGLPMTIRSGPQLPEWVPYADIPHVMEVAVLVCEDGGFYRHRGFDFRAMEKALRDDFIAGRFVRGASTISMQLAKNLYLGKEKTLSRKIEEAFLTMLLESRLTKQELMELYLNVVELGPGIYGIEQGAKYYFDESARDLSLGQALYLASILPDPTRQHFEPDGRVTARWAEYIRKLMRIARSVNRISDEELEAGLAEELAFQKTSGEARVIEPGDAEGAGHADFEPSDARE